MKMKIYFCREKDEYEGLFVVAETRGLAKKIFANEVDCHFTDVRTEIRRRRVPEFKGRCLCPDVEEDQAALERYCLEYDEYEG